MCNFRLDPEQWDGESGEVIECPYQSVIGRNFCIFHLSPYQRKRIFLTQQRIENKFIQTIAQNRPATITIFGTTIRTATLSTVMKAIPGETEIEIIHTHILGKLDMSEIEIPSRITISDCYIDEFDISRSILKKGIRIRDSQIDRFRADGTIFERYCQFEEIEFGKVSIQSSVFKQAVQFHGSFTEEVSIEDVDKEMGDRGCSFSETATFMGTKFLRGALFNGAIFSEAALFGHTEFQEGGSFYQVHASTGIDFNNSTFHDHTTFDQSDLGIAAFLDCQFMKSASFENATLGNDFTETLLRIESGESVSVDTIHEAAVAHRKSAENEFVDHYTETMNFAAALFNRSSIKGTAKMIDTELKGRVLANYADFEHLEVRFKSSLKATTSLFHQSQIREGTIHIINKHCYVELRNTTFGDVELTSENGINPFDQLYIDSTNFDEFEFSDYRAELEDIDWKIDGAYVDENYMPPTRREATYSKAKAGASELGDRTAESKFSVLEGRYRRKRYWDDLREASEWNPIISNFYNFGINKAYDSLSRYGESPQLVFAWSILTTFLFSLLYNSTPVWSSTRVMEIYLFEYVFKLKYSVDSYVFSVQSFTSFIVGRSSPSDLTTWIRLIASAESFIGAFLIALFVATVVRKIKR